MPFILVPGPPGACEEGDGLKAQWTSRLLVSSNSLRSSRIKRIARNWAEGGRSSDLPPSSILEGFLFNYFQIYVNTFQNQAKRGLKLMVKFSHVLELHNGLILMAEVLTRGFF